MHSPAVEPKPHGTILTSFRFFNREVKKWDPDQWAELFKDIGARYIVPTTRHHDGFRLWPSEVHNPHRKPSRSGKAAERPPVHLLRPFDTDFMKAWKVGPDVGNVKNDRPDLPEPIVETQSGSGLLF